MLQSDLRSGRGFRPERDDKACCDRSVDAFSGVTPEARARAMDNGRAMIATIMPATTSLTNCSRV
ncbi:MAG: hypothetical protein ACLURV_12145 [Gallintestinimicrobium sp.]